MIKLSVYDVNRELKKSAKYGNRENISVRISIKNTVCEWISWAAKASGRKIESLTINYVHFYDARRRFAGRAQYLMLSNITSRI